MKIHPELNICCTATECSDCDYLSCTGDFWICDLFMGLLKVDYLHDPPGQKVFHRLPACIASEVKDA